MPAARDGSGLDQEGWKDDGYGVDRGARAGQVAAAHRRTAAAAATPAGTRVAGFTEATVPRHLVLPATTSVPLVVKLLDSPHRPPAFVMGAHGSSTVVEGDCAPSYLEVLLAPLGAYTLLGLPIDRLGGQIVDLVDVLGPAGRRLGEQLRETPSWRRRFALLDEFLLRRLERGPRPKTAARLVRLNRVWRRLDERRPLDWGQVAADAGYADQAHVIRDFHQFTGTTPTQFQARTLPSHGDAEQEVNSVQDAVAAVS